MSTIGLLLSISISLVGCVGLSLLLAMERRKARMQEEALRKRFENAIDTSIAALKVKPNLEAEVLELCCNSLIAFKSGGYHTIRSTDLVKVLREFWDSGQDPYDIFRSSPTQPAAIRRIRTGQEVRVRITQHGWLVAMSDEFVKAIQCIDRKLQGKILEALTEIVQNPTVVKGDTMRPLSRELSGLWRYRLGDYRLIYQPLRERNEILLVTFASRGSIYE